MFACVCVKERRRERERERIRLSVPHGRLDLKSGLIFMCIQPTYWLFFCMGAIRLFKGLTIHLWKLELLKLLVHKWVRLNGLVYGLSWNCHFVCHFLLRSSKDQPPEQNADCSHAHSVQKEHVPILCKCKLTGHPRDYFCATWDVTYPLISHGHGPYNSTQ